MKKSYLILIILLFIIFVGVLFLIFKSFTIIDRGMATIPYVTVQAKVISINLDNSGKSPPNDKASLIIEGIDRTNDPRNLVDLDIGQEINVSFQYTARPSKLIYDLLQNCPEGYELQNYGCVKSGSKNSAVSFQIQSKVEFVDGYWIFHFSKQKNSPEEKILPGLQQNSIITFGINQLKIDNLDNLQPILPIGEYILS